jgi:hypothetical protein
MGRGGGDEGPGDGASEEVEDAGDDGMWCGLDWVGGWRISCWRSGVTSAGSRVTPGVGDVDRMEERTGFWRIGGGVWVRGCVVQE